MTSETVDTEIDSSALRKRALMHAGIAAAIIFFGVIAKSQLDWVVKYPRKWTIPLRDWITEFFEWLVYEVKFFAGTSFEFAPTDVTRGMIK